jgi:hypothetical protein
LDFTNLPSERTFLNELPDHRLVGTSTNLFAGPAFGFDSLFDEFPNISRNGVVSGGINIEQYHEETEQKGLRRYAEFISEAKDQGELTPSLINGLAVKIQDLTSKLSLPRPWDYGAQAIVSSGKKWVIDSDEPTFFFANFMEAHSPYEDCMKYDRSISQVPRGWSDDIDDWEINAHEATTQFGESLDYRRRVYTGAIDYLDRVITPFIEDLIESSNRETTVIVTADHGERLNLSEGNQIWGHVGELSHPLLHVPLEVINPPDGYDPNTSSQFSHLDLGELLVAFGDNETAEFDRRVIPAERMGLGIANEIGTADYSYWDRAIRTVYENGARTQWDSLGETKGFELTGPSMEALNNKNITVPESHRNLFENSLREYKSNIQKTDSDLNLNDETQQGLEALGYL